MNYQSLILILTIAVVMPFAACSRLASSGPMPKPPVTESIDDPTIGFLEPDNKANGDARDVLIPADRAKLAPALIEGDWINSAPLKSADLRGRVVLVDFWTFGCHNCVNTLPALKGFDTKYRSKGLTIIGVHTPEFEREKVIANLTEAVKKRGIDYPVLTDNKSANWNAFGVEAWPTVVILDKLGRIRYTHIGEGAYDMQERVIQTLLAENAASTTGSDDVFNGEKVVKSVEEWRSQLTADQFDVLREEGTEPAFSGEYNKHHEEGVYHCAACHLKLFSSKHKFESGTGWPSFYQPINPKNVTEKTDRAYGVTRTEVECSRCGSHLGHVFDDGPKPTGLRYCMNSVALKFERSVPPA